MANATALERLPMTMGYFRLILRCFGDTPERRRAILAGTRVGEDDLANPAAEISLFQQVRQIENVNAVHGDGWTLYQPELWNPTAHGALGVAVLSAPTLMEGLEVLRRYSHVRAPFFKLRLRAHGDDIRLVYELTANLEEPQWRPMMEIALVSIRALCAAVLGRSPNEARFRFACPRPVHAEQLRAALGQHIAFSQQANAVIVPRRWSTQPSPLADASLYRSALSELQAALERLENPIDLRAQVERLLHTMPDGRLGAGDVARALGVSRRSLARRLREANVQFRDLLDCELRQRAEKMLQAAALSRSDMAERLGYRDPTSFSRACRRWFAPQDQ